MKEDIKENTVESDLSKKIYYNLGSHRMAAFIITKVRYKMELLQAMLGIIGSGAKISYDERGAKGLLIFIGILIVLSAIGSCLE